MPTIPASNLVPGVTETEDFLVYYVASSQPERQPYRVDLEKFCGNGECSCPGFNLKPMVDIGGKMVTRRMALLKRAMPSPQLECPHIQRAKRYVNFVAINRIIQDREKQSYANKKAAQASTLGHRVHRAAQGANSSSLTGASKPSSHVQGGTAEQNAPAAIQSAKERCSGEDWACV